MAKTAKVKNKAPSIHSRAARRANSPTLKGNIDSSLLNLPRASTTRQNARPVLAPNVSGGISKRPKRGQHTRLQKARKEKGLQKADERSGKINVKLHKSFEKAKTIKNRSKDWEDVNDVTSTVSANKFAALKEAHDHKGDWIDMEEDQNEEPQATHTAKALGNVILSAKDDVSLPLPAEEDVIL